MTRKKTPERKLTEMGDPLERLSKTIDFEMFRADLEDTLLPKERKSNAGGVGAPVHMDEAQGGQMLVAGVAALAGHGDALPLGQRGRPQASNACRATARPSASVSSAHEP